MKKFLAFAAVAIMFVACSKDVVESIVDRLTGVPIRVNTNIVETRVAGMDSENDFSTFYLDISGETDYFATMTKGNDGKWSSETGMVWTNGNPVTVSAIMTPNVGWTEAGYGDAVTGNTTVKVNTDQSSDSSYKNSDLLYMAPSSVTPASDGSITVNFSHLMSKLVITIDTGSSEASDPVSSVKVGGTRYLRYFTPATNTWGTPFMKATEITAHTESYSEGKSVYEVILVPQDVEADTFYVSFEYDGKIYKWISDAAITLESGKIHTIALKAASNDPAGKAVAVSVNVAAWPTDTITIGGDEIEVTPNEQ